MGYHPDTLRKASVGLKWADEAGVLVMDAKQMMDDVQAVRDQADQSLEAAESKRLETELSMLQIRDERTAMRASLRFQARESRDRDYMIEQLERIGTARYIPTKEYVEREERDQNKTLVLTFADPHFGAYFDGYHGEHYDMDVARRRILAYCSIAVMHAEWERIHNAHVVVLGDLISGMIHKTIQVTNRENVVDQVMIAGEIMSDFLYELSEAFDNVSVTFVPGNHSRLDRKEDSLNGDRLDKVVMWYARGVLKHVGNIHWTESGDTISEFSINGHRYVAVHGDYDSFSENGLARLVSFVGYKPTAVFTAHKHAPAFMMFNDVYMIQSGSFVGSGDEYTERCRLCGRGSQLLCVADDKGIDSMKIVNFM